MSLPEIVTPEEWLAARQELLVKEKEHTRQRDARRGKKKASTDYRCDHCALRGQQHEQKETDRDATQKGEVDEYWHRRSCLFGSEKSGTLLSNAGSRLCGEIRLPKRQATQAPIRADSIADALVFARTVG